VSKRLHTKIILAILIAAGVLQVLAFLFRPFEGYDSPYHIFWIIEWSKLWHSGIMYPRWLPDYYMGYGSPAFYFYPPLTYFLTSTTSFISSSLPPDVIAKIVSLFTLAGSGISMWLYLRWRSVQKGIPQLAAVAGALIYTFAPYHFFDYATRTALSEHVALCFVPLAFWAGEMLNDQKYSQNKSFVFLSISIGLILLTNIPTAVCVITALFILTLLRGRNNIVKNILALSSAVIFSFFLAAFYLLPAIAFRNDVHIAYLWGHKPFMESSPFLAVFTRSSLAIIAYNFLMIVGAVMMLYHYRKNDRPTSWLLAYIVVPTLPLISYILFYYVFPFTIIQIPGRLFIILLVIIALKWQDEWSNTGSMVSKVVLLWSLAMIPLSAVHLFDLRIHALEQHSITDSRSYSSGWTTQYGDSTLFLHVPAIKDSLPPVWCSDSSAKISVRRGIYSDTIRSETLAETSVTLRRTYWPSWKIRAEELMIQTAADSIGRLTFKIPSGNHTIISSLEESSEEKIGWYISGGSIIFGAFLLTWKRRAKA
jgi:hypothetical protein